MAILDEAMVPDTVKMQIIRNKLQVWQNTLYDAQLDARIAEALDDMQSKERATRRMKEAHKAIDFLEMLSLEGEP